MVDLAVTLKPESPPSDPTPTNAAPPGGRRPDAMKFTYATGARPLDGYTIKRGIGSGGFGEVYYAISDAGKEVALKRIQRHLDIELRGVSQCLNLKHPNLLSLFDIRYDAQGEAWVVMEYIVGESLREVLDRHPDGLPVDQVQHWFRGLAAGVGYLHDRGIVHRDLKPGNVFLDDSIVKIGDYGLSKFISCSRRSGQTESVGTFHYMAPEIGRGSYGKQIDIYALGVILYEMLSGKVPFDGESTQEIIMKHLTAEPDLSVLPVAYREVVRRALLKDPEKRFRSVGEMIQVLRDDRGQFDPPLVAVAPGSVPEAIPHAGRTVTPATADVSHPATPEIVFGPVKQVAPNGNGAIPPVLTGAPRRAAGNAHGQAQEPIAQAVLTGGRRVMNWWNDSNVSFGLRLAVVIAVAVTLFFNMHWLIPVLMALALTYAVYLAVRTTVTAVASPGTAPVAVTPQPSATPVASTSARKSRPKGVELIRGAVAQRDWTTRLTEIFGGMLVSTLIAAVLTFVILLLGHDSAGMDVRSAAMYGWLLTTTLAGTWSVLILGKLWETSNGDAVRRRFVMLVVGLGIGLVAWGGHEFLRIGSSGDLIARRLALTSLEPQLMDRSMQQPLLPAYLLYFAAQFLLLRWWRQADALRYSRLSLWDTAVCVLGAFLVGQFIPFWSPWGPLLAAAMSLSVQLSASWLTPSQRAQLREQVLAA